ncbi:MAG: universal stress protein [Nocardiaceae bacterium]|nr:universal stress protein [Nocardiaceae bacterium]
MTSKPPERALTLPDYEVIVGVDDSRHTETAVRWAARTASERGRPLRIVHAQDIGCADPVLGVRYPDVSEALERVRVRGEDALARAVRTAHAVNPKLSVETEIASGSAAQTLVRCSESAYELVLAAGSVGESGSGTIGSTTAAVASRSHCPVVIVRGSTARDVTTPGPILLGMDTSTAVDGAVAAAFDEASLRGASLIVVHAWSDLRLGAVASRHELLTPPAEFQKCEGAAIAELLAPWREKYPDVQVSIKVYLDGPREHLLRWSQRAQLVVIGARGRGGLDGLSLGSTTTALIQQARCPVMVVRPRTITATDIGVRT